MKVFISYAMADAPLAQQIADSLKKNGMEVWDSTASVFPGENWATRIAEALQQSEAMVVLLTPQALRSNHVRHEISYALGNADYAGRLVPVWAATEDQFSKEEVPWILNSFQSVHLLPGEKYDIGLQSIVRAIKEPARPQFAKHF